MLSAVENENLFDIQLLLQTYKRAKLVEKIADEAYFYFLPFLLLFGGSILIATTFATVCMYDAFPKPYYYGLPFLSVKVLVAILALFPAASSVYDEPCRVMGKMRPVVKTLQNN